MTPKPFLRPRLVGTRFEECGIPLEFLKDLAVLEELIVEVAKWKFLLENQDRKRSPRGFTEGIGLTLSGVERGSTVPVISLAAAAGMPFPPDNRRYFEEARDVVVGAIAAAEEDRSVTDYLPAKTLGYFDRFGRSLRAGEAIEFGIPGREKPVRLTRESRKKLVLASKAREFTEETCVRGTVPEADQDDMNFEVQFADGQKVRAPMTAQHLDTILEAFNGYKNGTRVFLEGIGRFSRADRLVAFDSVEHVSILDALDIPARLDEFKTLKDGWLEGHGKAPSHEGLNWVATAFKRFYPAELPLPYLFPNEEGGIQAEWSFGANELSVEIDLVKHEGTWHSLDIATDREETLTLDLNEERDWNRMTAFIQEVIGVAL